jgi:hypothetical protein
VLAEVLEAAPLHHLPQTCRHHLHLPLHLALLLLLLLLLVGLVGLLLLQCVQRRRLHLPAVAKAGVGTSSRQAHLMFSVHAHKAHYWGSKHATTRTMHSSRCATWTAPRDFLHNVVQQLSGHL